MVIISLTSESSVNLPAHPKSKSLSNASILPLNWGQSERNVSERYGTTLPAGRNRRHPVGLIPSSRSTSSPLTSSTPAPAGVFDPHHVPNDPVHLFSSTHSKKGIPERLSVVTSPGNHGLLCPKSGNRRVMSAMPWRTSIPFRFLRTRSGLLGRSLHHVHIPIDAHDLAPWSGASGFTITRWIIGPTSWDLEVEKGNIHKSMTVGPNKLSIYSSYKFVPQTPCISIFGAHLYRHWGG